MILKYFFNIFNQKKKLTLYCDPTLQSSHFVGIHNTLFPCHQHLIPNYDVTSLASYVFKHIKENVYFPGFQCMYMHMYHLIDKCNSGLNKIKTKHIDRNNVVLLFRRYYFNSLLFHFLDQLQKCSPLRFLFGGARTHFNIFLMVQMRE